MGKAKKAQETEREGSPLLGEVCVSQVEIASILGITDRQVRKLEDRGFPRVDGGYPVARCVRWHRELWEEERLRRAASREQPQDMEEAELRKAIADAEIAELKLARLRGEVAPIDQYRQELRRVLGRVRSRFQSVPGEYAPQILEPMDMARAVAVLRGLVASVLAELQQVGEASDDEEPVEAEAA